MPGKMGRGRHRQSEIHQLDAHPAHPILPLSNNRFHPGALWHFRLACGFAKKR